MSNHLNKVHIAAPAACRMSFTLCRTYIQALTLTNRNIINSIFNLSSLKVMFHLRTSEPYETMSCN